MSQVWCGARATSTRRFLWKNPTPWPSCTLTAIGAAAMGGGLCIGPHCHTVPLALPAHSFSWRGEAEYTSAFLFHSFHNRRYDSVYDSLATFYDRVAIGGVVLCEFSWGALLWRRCGVGVACPFRAGLPGVSLIPGSTAAT